MSSAPGQYPDGPFIGIRSIIVSPAALFQGKSLVNAVAHVDGVLLVYVVGDEAALPKWSDIGDTLQLVRLLTLVTGDRKLVAADFTLLGKLVEKGVLDEVCLYQPPDS